MHTHSPGIANANDDVDEPQIAPGNGTGDDPMESEEHDVSAPSLRQLSDAARRRMQPRVDDLSEDDNEGPEVDGVDDDPFVSEDESIHGDDLFADAHDDSISAWERLGEEYERELAEIGAHHKNPIREVRCLHGSHRCILRTV